MADDTKPAVDQIDNIWAKDALVGDWVVVDPIIGREKVKAVEVRLLESPVDQPGYTKKMEKFVVFHLEQNTFVRVAIRGATEYIVHYKEVAA